jgi:hypothetical protein
VLRHLPAAQHIYQIKQMLHLLWRCCSSCSHPATPIFLTEGYVLRMAAITSVLCFMTVARGNWAILQKRQHTGLLVSVSAA